MLVFGVAAVPTDLVVAGGLGAEVFVPDFLTNNIYYTEFDVA